MNTNEVYSAITEKIIAGLQTSGSWAKLWQVPAPVSLEGRFYHGVNYLTLSTLPYTSRVFGTYQQVRQNGGQVRKGEKATIVVFWKIGTAIDEETRKERRTFLLRYYHVFNTEQCDFDQVGLDKIAVLNNMVAEKHSERFQPAEDIIANMPKKPDMVFSKSDDQAYYAPVADFISVPAMEYFHSPDEFYHTLFHEMTHSTGHPKRLDRFDGMSNRFGDKEYSKEELVAELGASFLSVVSGCKWNQRNSAAYIRGWSDKLRDNEKWIVWAASRAEKAVNFILNTENVDIVTVAEEETEPVMA